MIATYRITHWEMVVRLMTVTIQKYTENSYHKFRNDYEKQKTWLFYVALNQGNDSNPIMK